MTGQERLPLMNSIKCASSWLMPPAEDRLPQRTASSAPGPGGRLRWVVEARRASLLRCLRPWCVARFAPNRPPRQRNEARAALHVPPCTAPPLRPTVARSATLVWQV